MDFFEFYSDLFGARWPSLREALLGKNCPMEFRVGNSKPYFLDEASYFTANALDVRPGLNVLDMCAAPGGKTLVLARALSGAGKLQSNDRSRDRRERLRKVIAESLPENLSKIVSITGYPGENFGRFCPKTFDRILVDAPCSSERHVLNSPEHLSSWGVGRIKRLSTEQGALLASAVDALLPGGFLVYSTCALSPNENDCVVEKILKKRAGLLEVVPLEILFEGSERTRYGLRMLPDKCAGRGPIYCAKLKKKEEF